MKFSQRLAIGYTQTKFKLLTVISKKKTAEQAFVLFSTPFLKSKRKSHPKDAELIQLTLNNLNVKGYRWNYPQTQKALILHGFGSASHKFEDYATLLAQKGYEVMAFDAPAHGESDGTKTNAVEYSEMIKKIIGQYGPVHSFLAHSFGGIALSLALEKIPHDENTKIVFIAPATETTSAIDIAFARLKIKNTEVRKEFDKIILKVSHNTSDWFSMRRAMHNIKADVLWIHDEEDDITPWADALKVKEDNHSNVKFVITKGLGHRNIYHDPVIKNMIIEFM